MPHRRGSPPPAPLPPAGWTFLTNHAHVLFVLAQDPLARHRDVAARVGVTERAVVRLVQDLSAAGYLRVAREGRRNRYTVDADLPLRHPIERHRTARDLISLVVGGPTAPSKAAPAPRRGRRSRP